MKITRRQIVKLLQEAIDGEEPSITTRDHRGSVTSYKRPREEDPGDTGPTDYTIPQASLRDRRKQFVYGHISAVIESLGMDPEDVFTRAKIVEQMNQNNSFVVQTAANPPTLFFSAGFRFPDGEAAVANPIQRKVTHAAELDGRKTNDSELIGADVGVDITDPESLKLGGPREDLSENKIKVTRSQLRKLMLEAMDNPVLPGDIKKIINKKLKEVYGGTVTNSNKEGVYAEFPITGYPLTGVQAIVRQAIKESGSDLKLKVIRIEGILSIVDEDYKS